MVVVINILAFNLKDITDYFYIFDAAYVIGNSAHFIALSISKSGINMKDEKK